MENLFIENDREMNEHGVYGIEISEVDGIKSVATVWLDERSEETIKDSEDYAKAMATAPDMLNALIEIQEYINKMGVVSMAMQNIKNKCKAVIKLATE